MSEIQEPKVRAMSTDDIDADVAAIRDAVTHEGSVIKAAADDFANALRVAFPAIDDNVVIPFPERSAVGSAVVPDDESDR